MKVLTATFFLLSAVAKAADTNELSPLAPAYGEIPGTFLEQHIALVIIGGITLIVLAAVVLWQMLKPKPTVVLPPEVMACQALAKLQGLPEDGKILSEASQILRRYFSAAFGLPATEMTTAEFCAALTAHDKIGGELAHSVSNLLSVCDKDKFSPKIIAPPINAVDRVRELVSRSEVRLVQLTSVNPPQP